MSILALSFLLMCTPTALLEFAFPKWRSDNNVRIEDTYKYLYQATRGGEHAVPDRESAKRWLDNEWKTMGDEPKGENEWQPLCPAGENGRLNLRPYKAVGGKVDDLLDAFLISSREYRSEPKAFTDVWSEFGNQLKQKGFGKITYKEWQRLDKSMKKKDYPAIHHSDHYKKTYRPAYRVLTAEQAQRLIPT